MITQLNIFLRLGLVLLSSAVIGQQAFAATHKNTQTKNTQAKNTQALDRIIAVVNDTVITQSELDQALFVIKKQMASSQVPLPPSEALHKQVLDQLINKKLQLQVAEQAGIQVTDTDVDNAIGNIAKANNVSPSDLYNKLAEQGINTADYRSQIHEELTLQHIEQQEVGAKISIAPEEVKDFMRSKSWQAFNTKEYHLEDILIALPDTPTPQQVIAAKTRAQTLRDKLNHGLSFKEAAAAESNEESALQGGDLGWRKLPEIPSAFATSLVHMKANEILGPVQTPNGFHIVRLAEVRNMGGKVDAGQEQSQVQQLIFQRKFEEAIQGWIAKLRSAAFINTHPEEMMG